MHSASDTEHGWPWYGDLVGASFVFHPPVQDGTVRVTDRRHPSTRFLPRRWPRTDEWYAFDRWYTALGHPDEAYADPPLRRHLLRGIEWAAGLAGGSCDPDTDPDVVSILHDPDTGAFSGGVFASRRRCEARRAVVVLKVRPGHDREVRRRRTNASGDWRLGGFESPHGRFRAVAPRDEPCDTLRSTPIRTG